MAIVTIQPATKDTYFDEGYPSTNYYSNASLSVGNMTSHRKSALLTFDFSATIPAGATITAAILSLYNFSPSSGYTLNVYRLLRTDWVQSAATWLKYKSTANWGLPGARSAGVDYTTVDVATAVTPSTSGWLSWDVKKQIQTGLDAVSGVAHFLITTAAAGIFTNNFRSSNYTGDTTLRPKLYIEYALIPNAPTDAYTDIKTDTQIFMRWTNNSSDETGFKLYKNGIYVTTIAAGSTSYTYTGLTAGTTYDLAVKATNAAGDSAEAKLTEITALPPPAAPIYAEGSRYKIEIFQRDFTYRSHASIPEQEIQYDYLTLEKTQINAYTAAAVKGDYAQITDYLGNQIYIGIVDNVDSGSGSNLLTLKPLLALLDVSAYYDRSTLVTIEQFIAGIITATYISNADTSQNLSGLTVTALTSTAATLDLESNIIPLWTVITKALTVYSVVVTAEFRPGQKKIVLSIAKTNVTAPLEADLENVLEKSIIIGDSYGQLNKVTYINELDETEKAIYYLHSDGTISTADEDRVTPVFFSEEIISGSNFAVDALAKAIDVLTPQQYNNVIELTYNLQNRLFDAAKMAIGTVATIYVDGVTHKSILTGFARTEKAIKLIFGVVRVELTKRLILEGRK